MSDFSGKMQQYQSLVEACLQERLDGGSLHQADVFDAMAYSVAAGGKRIRPVLLLAFCEGLGGDLEKAVPFAAAIEMIHSYSLIHDDLPCMDDDDMRRGKPACHIQYGEAMALLAGDGLLNRAFETMLDHCDSPQTVAAARTLASHAGVEGMIGGQVIDWQAEDRPLSEHRLLQMYRLKTGKLIAAACKMGCQLAGADAALCEASEEYGYKLGLAFQIIDDLLDIYGDAKMLGKPTGSDWENHKLTYASLHTREEAQKTATELTDQALELLSRFSFRDSFLSDLTKQLLRREK